jgi:hypothetical protein
MREIHTFANHFVTFTLPNLPLKLKIDEKQAKKQARKQTNLLGNSMFLLNVKVSDGKINS